MLRVTGSSNQGSWFRDLGSWFGVKGYGFMALESVFTDLGSLFGVRGDGFMAPESGFMVHGSWFSVHGSVVGVTGFERYLYCELSFSILKSTIEDFL